MRIGLVSQEYPPHTAFGGIGSQTWNKAHGLTSLGHHVQVISHGADDRTTTEQSGKLTVTRIPGFDSKLPVQTDAVRWLTYSAEVAAAILRLHNTEPFDLLDFPDWGAEAYVYLLNRTESHRIPTVIQLHGPLVMFAHALGWPQLESEFYRVGTHMEGTCLRLADAVFSSSRCSIDWCVRHYGLDPTAIPVIHAGVDTQLFSPPASRRPGPRMIVFVGKIARNKGVELLLDAALRLSTECPDLQLRLIGRGERQMVESLRRKAKAAGKSAMLDLPGFIDRRDLPQYLREADVFAAPSYYEGGPGFVYLEAMACGLPVIGCEGSGANEAIIPEQTGLLVPPGNVEALVGALRRLLTDAEDRRAMGQQARDYVCAKADSQSCLKQLAAFYSTVVDRAGRGQR